MQKNEVQKFQPSVSFDFQKLLLIFKKVNNQNPIKIDFSELGESISLKLVCFKGIHVHCLQK